MGYKIFDFILIVNNWITHTTHIKTNIPKSGCIINIIEIKERQKRFIIREKSSFILYRTNNRELKIINVGLANSDGWIEKYIKLSHLVAPFVSCEMIRAIKHKIIDKKNNDIDNIIICLVESFEIMKIVKRLNRQKIKCLFHMKFDLRLIVPNFCDALEIAIMPMNSRINIGIKIIY